MSGFYSISFPFYIVLQLFILQSTFGYSLFCSSFGEMVTTKTRSLRCNVNGCKNLTKSNSIGKWTHSAEAMKRQLTINDYPYRFRFFSLTQNGCTQASPEKECMRLFFRISVIAEQISIRSPMQNKRGWDVAHKSLSLDSVRTIAVVNIANRFRDNCTVVWDSTATNQFHHKGRMCRKKHKDINIPAYTSCWSHLYLEIGICTKYMPLVYWQKKARKENETLEFAIHPLGFPV